jgi:hypothetical protein
MSTTWVRRRAQSVNGSMPSPCTGIRVRRIDSIGAVLAVSYHRFAGSGLNGLGALSDGVFAVAMTLLVLET